MLPNPKTLIALLAPWFSFLLFVPTYATPPDSSGPIAPKPLFRDPIEDGAADPTPIWNPLEKKWFLFYTNRRAMAPPDQTPGVTWVHGTRIGIAQSSDGVLWTYRGIADIQYGNANTTQWAPEVIQNDRGSFDMFLAIVPGIFTDWNHPRDIIHLTSNDLLHWTYQSTLKLSSDRSIDPCVLKMPDGSWRMWYNNERDHKSIWFADSPDLSTWTDKSIAIADQPGEGPIAFRWHDHYWLIVNIWHGLAVYKSNDAQHWTRQPENILDKPGTGQDDNAPADHPGIEISNNRAYLFYFVHPGRTPTTLPATRPSSHDRRRSSIQVVELKFQNDFLTCDRDQPTHIQLIPPGGRG